MRSWAPTAPENRPWRRSWPDTLPMKSPAGKSGSKGRTSSQLDPEERASLRPLHELPISARDRQASRTGSFSSGSERPKKRQRDRVLSDADFEELLDEKMAAMEIRPEFKERNINKGFSGEGKKRRNEILQLALFDPDLAILDENGFGARYRRDADCRPEGQPDAPQRKRASSIITHYQRLLDYIRPDCVHVLARRTRSPGQGGPELALELEQKGDQVKPIIGKLLARDESIRKRSARAVAPKSLGLLRIRIGLPKPKQEAFQYLPLQKLTFLKTRLEKNGTPPNRYRPHLLPECRSSHLVFVDGLFR